MYSVNAHDVPPNASEPHCIADLLRETDPLQTILGAILRRHHDSAEFTTIVIADVAEHLKSELGYYKEHYASTVVEAQRNPADPRLQRSFLSVLCVCLAAIRSGRRIITPSSSQWYESSNLEYVSQLMKGLCSRSV